jgi:hypothetical protein
MDKLNNSVTVPVVDQLGRVVDEREFVNIPFAELYPDDDFVVIDWVAADDERPSEQILVTPVEHDGKPYHGHWAWGSSVKTGQTIGLTHDIGHEAGMVKNAEDGQRVQRWLLAQGIFGGLKGQFRIGVCKPGTRIAGAGPVEDGFGYIRRDLAEQGFSGLDKIRLGKAKGSYTFWQRVRPWTDALEAEIRPLIDERLVNVSDGSGLLYEQASTFDEKKALVELDESMIEHPFVANALSRAAAETFARMATTAPLGSEIKVAVPTTCEQVVYPGKAGKLICVRYPVDSNGSVQAVDTTEEDQGEYALESVRIATMEVLQVTIAARDFFSKGCLGIVDELPDDLDMIICSEDIKMSTEGVNETRKRAVLYLEAVCGYTQYFGAGSAAGVNPKWAKDLMGLDNDGDMVEVTDANALPVLWDTVAELPFGETPKLAKSKSPIGKQDRRPEMILKSMSNLVGYASNVVSNTFMVADREYLAKQLGFESEVAMDRALNYYIKVGTDGFKTLIDTRPIERHLAVLQSNMQNLFGTSAPWTNWPNEFAFKRGIPVYIERAIPTKDGMRYQVGGAQRELDKQVVANSIFGWRMDGTIPNICRLTLPALEAILDTPIRTQPLTAYRNWALSTSKVDYECAKVIQSWYNARVRRVNWSDPDSIATFKAALNNEITVWVEREELDRKVAASALWRVAHSTRSQDAGGASVFVAFPDEAKWIVEHKPGYRDSRLATVLTGLHYQLPYVSDLEADVTVVEVKTQSRGKVVVRKAVAADVKGQLKPTGDVYPDNMIAMVAINADQPQTGQYHAIISQISNKAWKCELVGL